MLELYRDQIDQIDLKLLALLKERIELSQKIALYKQEHNLPVEQPNREEQILANLKKQNLSPLSPIMVEELWQNIFKFSKKVQSLAKTNQQE